MLVGQVLWICHVIPEVRLGNITSGGQLTTKMNLKTCPLRLYRHPSSNVDNIDGYDSILVLNVN